MKFYQCPICKKMITIFSNDQAATVCCGKTMEELTANTVEASIEKHVPVVDVIGNVVKVQVGSAEHPMLPEHYIEWICLETENGHQFKKLAPGDAPVAEFVLDQDKAIAVYAYCNLHGLWKTEVKTEKKCPTSDIVRNSSEDYIICNCKQVSYFTILDEVKKHGRIENLLEVFEDVRNNTQCSTGCGCCYNKVLAVISEVLSS